MMTPRKQAFVDHYLTCHNATEAAKRAQYSAKTAKQAGSRLLSDVDVQAALAEARQQAQEQAGVTTGQLVAELARIGLADVGEDPKLSHKLKALELLLRHAAWSTLETLARVGKYESFHRENGHAHESRY